MGRKLPPMNSLRVFEAVARHASLSAAAEELSVTRGAVSQQLKILEDWLGARLVDRTTNPISLTLEGEEYSQIVRTSLDAIAIGSQRLSGHLPNTLSISASANFASMYLIDRLAEFSNLYPDIVIKLSTSNDYVDLQAEYHDIAIRHGNGDWKDVRIDRLGYEMVFAVCSPELLEEHPIQRIDDIARLGVRVLDYAGSENWELWSSCLGTSAPALDRRSIFDHASLVVRAAISGYGVAIARSLLVIDALHKGDLVRPFPDALPAPFGFYLVHTKTSHRKPEVRVFREWLLEKVSVDLRRLNDS
ncbi:MAG: LysR family transcriptional regulator [Alphaproteobacteria bacterium]|jgi:LysR family transcriptional regulator, glycine cleavage system transcriptional activator|nr:LysR family transcriptional regulator [Alphaproteobacteria bacterium]MBU1550107.1 LysR family transcriptional regulator [Alphaproteobacteria bacterium]MBU2337091.1 LysR family transcriptional regulator [Alphaproteobacteria bacterium]MBU2389422.1 LysR family transcriptional regulator [Alphaproteobacteria bacterium]